MKKNAILYPFLFAMAPILGLYSDNVPEAHFGDIVRSLLCSLVIMLAVVLVTIALVKGIAKAGFPALLFAFFVFGYDHLMRLVWPTLRTRHVLPVWIVFWVATYVASVIWMRRTKRDLTRLTQVLNLVGAAIVLGPLAMSSPAWFPEDPSGRLAAQGKSLGSMPATTTQPSSDNPDIYYIILDAYARADILKDRFSYDNSPFIEKLRKKGFYVADKSNSNYRHTHLSLTATLNLTYLDEHVKELGVLDNTLDSWHQAFNYFAPMIADSRLRRYLEARGYQTLARGTRYNVTRLLDRGGTEDMNEFELAVLQHTVFAEVFKKWVPGLSVCDIQRGQVRRIFRAVPTIAETPGPKFVFLHIACPHRPFMFNADGGDQLQNEMYGDIYAWEDPDWVKWYREYYAAQVQGLNVYVEKAIDQILAAAPKPPIIIIQGDHGPRTGINHDLDKCDIQQDMGILNAIYLPGGATPQLYPEISSVNTFRVILNRCFGENYPLLPDRSFHSTWGLKLTEVTDRVNPGGNRP